MRLHFHDQMVSAREIALREARLFVTNRTLLCLTTLRGIRPKSRTINVKTIKLLESPQIKGLSRLFLKPVTESQTLVLLINIKV